jgi:L-ribulose-5-phosphate 3-epimerase
MGNFITHKTTIPFLAGTAQQKYLKAEDGARSAAANGYSHWYVDGSLEGERPADWPETRIKALRDLAGQLGVRPIYHGNFKIPLGSDVREMREAAVAYVSKEVDLSARLGAPLILHGGGIVEPRKIKEVRHIALDGLVENLNRLTEYAKDQGVEIWLENLCDYTKFHPFYYVYTKFEEFDYVLSRAPAVSFILDVSHAHVNNGDPVGVFDAFHKRIVAMAWSDNMGVFDSHMPLGNGNVDYPRLIKSIIERNWAGVLSFETRGSELTDSLAYIGQLAATCLELRGQRYQLRVV